MSVFQASVVADSVNPLGIRLTTVKLLYPRIVHDQLLMHRAFSRSCSSSRAIPTDRLIEEVMKTPVVFYRMGYNQSGMVPGEVLNEDDMADALRILEEHRNFSVMCALRFKKIGVHKQWANRFLDMHSHISVVVTSTEWSNWDSLRLAGDAQSEIGMIAQAMKEARDLSVPVDLTDGEWHLPFIQEHERSQFDPIILSQISAARCARTSLKRHDQEHPDTDKDRQLAAKLWSSRHSNPFEHQAISKSTAERNQYSGNLDAGWMQLRKMMEIHAS